MNILGNIAGAGAYLQDKYRGIIPQESPVGRFMSWMDRTRMYNEDARGRLIQDLSQWLGVSSNVMRQMMDSAEMVGMGTIAPVKGPVGPDWSFFSEGRNPMERLFGRDVVSRTRQGEINAENWLRRMDMNERIKRAELLHRIKAAAGMGGVAAGAAAGTAEAE